MSTVIDNKIVEMRFDNAQFERETRKTMTTLDELKAKLQFKGAEKDFEAIQKASNQVTFDKMASGIETVANRFTFMGRIANSILESIATKVANVGEKAVKALTITPLMSGFSEYELKMNSMKTILANMNTESAADALTEAEKQVAKEVISGKYGNGKARQDMLESMGYDYEKIQNAIDNVIKINGYATDSFDTLDTSVATTEADVNDLLDELNEYADDTIYNFAQMTDAIGRFTTAGVNVKDATVAVKGLANLAAVAGADNTQLARTYIQVAQALNTGTMMLQDWRSLENANIATVQFQNVIKETAREHGVAVDQMIDKEGSFRLSLSQGWLTNEILLESLQKYTDKETELGQKAYKAAQDVRTFSIMMDQLRESLGSGWTRTWELVIGQMDEATEFWTKLTNVITGFIEPMDEARNHWLEMWKKNGGRQAAMDGIFQGLENIKNIFGPILDAVKEITNNFFPGVWLTEKSRGFKELNEEIAWQLHAFEVWGGRQNLADSLVNIWNAVRSFVKPIIDAFREVFNLAIPKDFGNELANLTVGIKRFTEGLILPEQKQKVINELATKIFQSFKKTFTVIKPIAGVLINLLGIIGKVMDKLFEFFAGEEETKKHFKDTKAYELLGAALNALKNIITSVAKAFTTVWTRAKEAGVLDKIAQKAKALWKTLEPFGELAIDKLIDSLNALASKDITFPSAESVAASIESADSKWTKFIKDLKDTKESIVSWWNKLWAGNDAKDGPGWIAQMKTNIENVFNNPVGTLKMAGTNILDFLKSAAGGIKEFVTTVLDSGLLQAGLMASAIYSLFNLGALFKTIKTNGILNISKTFNAVTKFFNTMSTSIHEFLHDSVKTYMLVEIAKSIALFAASLALLSKMDRESVVIATFCITAILAMFTKILEGMSKLAIANAEAEKLKKSTINFNGILMILSIASAIMGVVSSGSSAVNNVSDTEDLTEKIGALTLFIVGSFASIAEVMLAAGRMSKSMGDFDVKKISTILGAMVVSVGLIELLIHSFSGAVVSDPKSLGAYAGLVTGMSGVILIISSSLVKMVSGVDASKINVKSLSLTIGALVATCSILSIATSALGKFAHELSAADYWNVVGLSSILFGFTTILLYLIANLVKSVASTNISKDTLPNLLTLGTIFIGLSGVLAVLGKGVALCIKSYAQINNETQAMAGGFNSARRTSPIALMLTMLASTVTLATISVQLMKSMKASAIDTPTIAKFAAVMGIMVATMAGVGLAIKNAHIDKYDWNDFAAYMLSFIMVVSSGTLVIAALEKLETIQVSYSTIAKTGIIFGGMVAIMLGIAASLAAVKNVGWKEMLAFGTALAIALAGMIVYIKILGKAVGSVNFNGDQLKRVALLMVGLGTAVLMISASMSAIAKLNTNGITGASLAMIGIISAMTLLVFLVSKMGEINSKDGKSGIMKNALAFSTIVGSLVVSLAAMAGIMFAISKIDSSKMDQVLTSLAVMMGGIAIIVALGKSSGNVFSFAASLLSLAGAMVVALAVVPMLGWKLDDLLTTIEKHKNTLIVLGAIGAVLTTISFIFADKLDKIGTAAVKAGAGFVEFSLGLAIIAKAADAIRMATPKIIASLDTVIAWIKSHMNDITSIALTVGAAIGAKFIFGLFSAKTKLILEIVAAIAAIAAIIYRGRDTIVPIITDAIYGLGILILDLVPPLIEVLTVSVLVAMDQVAQTIEDNSDIIGNAVKKLALSLWDIIWDTVGQWIIDLVAVTHDFLTLYKGLDQDVWYESDGYKRISNWSEELKDLSKENGEVKDTTERAQEAIEDFEKKAGNPDNALTTISNSLKGAMDKIVGGFGNAGNEGGVKFGNSFLGGFTSTLFGNNLDTAEYLQSLGLDSSAIDTMIGENDEELKKTFTEEDMRNYYDHIIETGRQEQPGIKKEASMMVQSYIDGIMQRKNDTKKAFEDYINSLDPSTATSAELDKAQELFDKYMEEKSFVPNDEILQAYSQFGGDAITAAIDEARKYSPEEDPELLKKANDLGINTASEAANGFKSVLDKSTIIEEQGKTDGEAYASAFFQAAQSEATKYGFKLFSSKASNSELDSESELYAREYRGRIDRSIKEQAEESTAEIERAYEHSKGGAGSNRYENAFSHESTSGNSYGGGGHSRSVTSVEDIAKYDLKSISEETKTISEIVQQNLDKQPWVIGFELEDTATEGLPDKTKAVADAVGGNLQRQLQPNGHEAGNRLMLGVSHGIDNNSYKATSSAQKAANDIMNTFNATLRIASPSKAFAESAKYCMYGFSEGLTTFSTIATKNASTTGEQIMTSFMTPIARVSKIASGEFKMNDSITPVIDSTKLARQANGINDLVGQQTVKLSGINSRITNDVANKMGETNLGNADVVSELASMREDIYVLGDAISKMKVVMDGDAEVGHISARMDAALGRRQIYKGRNN